MNSSPFLALLQMPDLAVIVRLTPGHFFLDPDIVNWKKKKTHIVLEISHSVFLHSISLRAIAWVDLNTKYAVRICRLICFECIKYFMFTEVKFQKQIIMSCWMLEWKWWSFQECLLLTWNYSCWSWALQAELGAEYF